MEGYLIRKGKSHTLVSLARGEAFSFNSFGEGINKVNAKEAYAFGMNSSTPIKIVSILGKGCTSEVLFDNSRVIVPTSVLSCQASLRELPLESHIVYRVNHKSVTADMIMHVILALNVSVSRSDISSKLGIPDSLWEPFPFS